MYMIIDVRNCMHQSDFSYLAATFFVIHVVFIALTLLVLHLEGHTAYGSDLQMFSRIDLSAT